MPKKFRGENTKAVESKARKAAAAEAVRAKKEKDAEDAYWADDDKSRQRKQQRKADKEMKKAENWSKKKEREEMYNAEMDSLKSAKPTATKPTKVTRAQIAENAKQVQKETEPAPEKETDRIEENINRVVGGLVAGGEIVEARSVEDAISALSVASDADRHPERRMKAAYTKFEEENLPRLKKENPNLRMSQLKQMLKKDWQKSTENPMNQRFIAYNSKT